MSQGLINITAHNSKISEIEKAKSILDEAKPKLIRTIGIPVDFDGVIKGRKNTRISFSYEGDGTLCDSLKIITDGAERCWIKMEDAINVAACVIKAFGPIPQELIDKAKPE